MSGKYNSKNDIKMKIPKDVERIIKVLEDAGYEAFAVGGCVRDTILGKQPQDWDITTSARPEQTKQLFRRTIDTGIKHGTVTIMIGKIGYEVTTYRIDGEYEDNRHPTSVQFTSNLVEDLKRRDFTMNAMAYNPKTGIVDAFGGLTDLKNRVIRCVGVPRERFTEDALRILRALRFSAQLGFDIDKNTMEAMKELSPTLEKISAERIKAELEKMILSDNPGKLKEAYDVGITKVILPEFDEMMACRQDTPYHMYNVGIHTIKVMENVPNDRILRWAALLHDVAKPDTYTFDKQAHFLNHAHVGAEKARKIMRRLKMDNKTIQVVAKLVDCHDDRPAQKGHNPENIRISVHKIGKDIYPMYLQLVAADFAGKSEYGRRCGYEDYLYAAEVFQEIVKKNQCTKSSELNITGKEMIAMGIGPGPEIGDIFDELLKRVLKDPELNKNEILKEMTKEISKK